MALTLKNKLTGFSVTGTTALCAYGLIAILLIMVVTITIGGISRLNLEFITTAPREGMTEGGIFPAIYGTVLLVFLMSIAGVPVGVITAIYLCEYVSQASPIIRIIRFAVNTLAGIPSIVFGLFGLGFFVQFIGKGMDSLFLPAGQVLWGQPALIWASLTMAILTLPVVIVSVEEAIRTIPRELREASLALGATRWETVLKVVLPNSFSGIMTGAILAISRAAGEVAPILFTGAAYFLPHLPSSLSDQFMNLGYHVYIMSTQSPDVDQTKPLQYATTLVLLTLTVAMNMIATVFRYRMRKNRIS